MKRWQIRPDDDRPIVMVDVPVPSLDETAGPSTRPTDSMTTPPPTKIRLKGMRNMSAEKLANSDFNKLNGRVMTRSFRKKIGLAKRVKNIEPASGIKLQKFFHFK